jgi:hypothetical protein
MLESDHSESMRTTTLGARADASAKHCFEHWYNTNDNLAWRAYPLDVGSYGVVPTLLPSRFIAALSRRMRLSTKPPWTTAISSVAAALGSRWLGAYRTVLPRREQQ